MVQTASQASIVGQDHEIQTASEPAASRYLEFDTIFHECPSQYGENDPPAPDWQAYQNPKSWSTKRKSATTWLSCFCTVFTAYTPGAYATGASQYELEWHISRVAAFSGVTVFTTCFAFAPMILAPLSEIQGRRPVFIPAGIIYVLSQVGSAVTQSFAGMLVTRGLAGISSSVFSSMVGGVLSDMYSTEHRNTPMTIFSGGTMFGTGLGPLIAGITSQHLSWRWIFYVQIITCSVILVALAVLFKETRGSIIISRKARALNKWYDALEAAGHVHRTVVEGEKPQRIRWRACADEERASIATMIKISLCRPFHLLFTESVVFWFSLWVSFAWAVLYMTFEALPLIFKNSHGFNDEQNGAVFAAIMVASALSVVVGIWQGNVAQRSSKFPASPEGRLYFTCVQGMLLPIGLFWLGWTSFPSIPWIVPVLAAGCVTMGIFSIYLAVFNYFADVYHLYASSAIAAQSFARNMFGGAIPLFADQMFTKLSFQGASSLLGGIAIVLSCVPWVLVAYGEKIRGRSKIASNLVGT
ncbi:MAG: hypothetical protein MMC23_007898 [Stictis urceolatum]|nr:hypothetical protein [Stictis urceolata]